ncbi:Asp23/Gls24 family envelope stress response protein [Priestia abyssalis]|uniref:Asp23/Gls24 family envelope stress response protein n=1 Tax=Priestia abyssalis TaxID=1221450 RepID=UPI000994B1CD|nr:Asp23/Gls24 family envelope stress response protein [Priestia abyssalis]
MSKQKKEWPIHPSIAEIILTICFEEYSRKFDRHLSLLQYNFGVPTEQRKSRRSSIVNLDLIVAASLTQSLLKKCEELQQMVKKEFELMTGLNVKDIRIYIKKVIVDP